MAIIKLIQPTFSIYDDKQIDGITYVNVESITMLHPEKDIISNLNHYIKLVNKWNKYNLVEKELINDFWQIIDICVEANADIYPNILKKIEFQNV